MDPPEIPRSSSRNSLKFLQEFLWKYSKSFRISSIVLSGISSEFLKNVQQFLKQIHRSSSNNFFKIAHGISSEFRREFLQISYKKTVGSSPEIPTDFRHSSSRKSSKNFIGISPGILQSSSSNSSEIFRSSARNSSGVTPRVPLDFLQEIVQIYS